MFIVTDRLMYQAPTERHVRPPHPNYSTQGFLYSTFKVDTICGIVNTVPMDTNNQNDPASEGLNLSDPRHQLIYALRLRLIALRAAEPTAPDKSTSHAQPENTPPQAGTAEYQPLSAETQPEHSRNTAETQPEYSGHSAGTSDPQSAPTDAGAPSSNNRKRAITESALDELPADTQAAILQLLDALTLDRATLEITSKPPYGLGIQTTRSSLYRFHKRHTTAKITRTREQDAAETAHLLRNAKSAGQISHTAIHLIAIRLLETAVLGNSNPSDLLALSKAIDRLRAVEHSERRLRLAEQKVRGSSAIPNDPTEVSSAVAKASAETESAVPKGRTENSSAFERREPRERDDASPEGTTEPISKISK